MESKEQYKVFLTRDEEYEKAKNDLPTLNICIKKSNERIMKLLDQLCSERESLKMYKEAQEYSNKVVMEYEIRKEVEEKEKLNSKKDAGKEKCNYSFSKEYPTWIIAFCPDYNSFFATNQRGFFWQHEQDFPDEESAIKFFKENVDIFKEKNKSILENTGGWKYEDSVFLENTKERL